MLIRFGLGRIERIMDVLYSKFEEMGGEKKIWVKNFEEIRLDFFQEILSKADRVLIRYDDVLAYCHTVTIS